MLNLLSTIIDIFIKKGITMSAFVTDLSNGAAIEDIEFDFGEAKVADTNSKGDMKITMDKKSFLSNAAKAGLTKDQVTKVFKYAKAHNEALVNHAVDEAPKHFQDDKVKRVIVNGGYGIRGTSTVTIQKEKKKPLGGLGSGKTITEPYVSFKVRDASLPSKDAMKEKVAELIKAL